jgi:rSAM/selenodomain-associated transferase 1
MCHAPARRRLLIFAKAPIEGYVKTRLVPPLSNAEAAALQRMLIEHTLQTARTLSAWNVELWCAPDTSHPFLQQCAQRFGVRLRAQRGDDLGQRMQNALDSALGDGARWPLLIGTDCAAMQSEYLQDAAAMLEAGNQVVLGPAEDGGYVLIGVRAIDAQLFSNIPWGTSRVLPITQQRLSNVRWHSMPTLWDVDRPEDLQRLRSAMPNWP